MQKQKYSLNQKGLIMKKNKLLTLITVSSVCATMAAVVCFASSKQGLFATFANVTDGWYHYAAVAPTATTHGSREFWAHSSDACATHQFTDPGEVCVERDFSTYESFTNLAQDDDRYVTPTAQKFTSNAYVAVVTDRVYATDTYSFTMSKTSSDPQLFFKSEVLTEMGDNDYLLFSVYGTSSVGIQFIDNLEQNPWATTIGNTSANDWAQVVVTKQQLTKIVNDPTNYYVRLQAWDNSLTWYISEFSYAKEPTSLDFETKGNAYISNSFVHGDDTYSVLLSSGGSDPCIYFKGSVLTAMGDNTKLVFYVYSALSANHRFVVNDPWAPVALGTLSANTWNKVTLTKEQVAQIVGDKTNYWYSIQSWDYGGWYISEFSFEA